MTGAQPSVWRNEESFERERKRPRRCESLISVALTARGLRFHPAWIDVLHCCNIIYLQFRHSGWTLMVLKLWINAIGNRERGFLMPNPPSSCCASGRSLACSTSSVIHGRGRSGAPGPPARRGRTGWSRRCPWFSGRCPSARCRCAGAVGAACHRCQRRLTKQRRNRVPHPTNGATRNPGLEPTGNAGSSASRNSPHRHRPHPSHSGCPHRCGGGLTAVGPPLSGRCDAGRGYPLTVRRNGAVMKIVQGTTFAGLAARR